MRTSMNFAPKLMKRGKIKTIWRSQFPSLIPKFTSNSLYKLKADYYVNKT